MKLGIFDFDETVVGFKTMFRFLEFADDSHVEAIREMQAMAARGASREDVNRYYYSRFAGVTRRQLAKAAEDWFRYEERRGLPLLEWTCGEIRRLRDLGYRIVVVTGSFPELIEPFRTELGLEVILAADLEETWGRLTGRLVGEPVIGTGKARAVRAYADRVGADLAQSRAYGDHISDIAMLETVRTATAINPDPGLREYAVGRGWSIVTTGVVQSETRNTVTGEHHAQ